MKISFEEFKSQVSNLVEGGRIRFTVRGCSMCDYPLSYMINKGEVYFDSGCYCVNYGPHITKSSREDFFETLDMQPEETVGGDGNTYHHYDDLVKKRGLKKDL